MTSAARRSTTGFARWPTCRRCSPSFSAGEIFIKDLERGLMDFPAIIGGREVFLCWEQDEDDIEFWHDLDTGFSGRERL